MWSITQFRRLPRSSQASVMLRGTVFAICLTLGIWLVLWLLFVRARVNLVAALPDPLPVSLHSVSGLLPPAIDKDEGIWEQLELELEVQEDSLIKIRSSLRKHSGRPTILYLTAPVATVDTRFEADDGVLTTKALRNLIDVCKNRPGKAKLLLIVDLGRVGPLPLARPNDRDIASYLQLEGSPPKDDDEALVWNDQWRNFGILCACSPGQCSWPLESEGRTIFDLILRRTQAKPRKLKPMIKLISYAVGRCVRDYYATAQNPMYVGDPGLDFFIPAAQPRVDADRENRLLREQQGMDDAWKSLKGEYTRRDDLAKRKPYRYAPIAWREYQEHLLRAERLLRARRRLDAVEELTNAKNAERGLFADIGFGSLAMGIHFAEDPEKYKKVDDGLSTALAARKPKELPLAPPVANKKDVLPTGKVGAPPANAQDAPANPSSGGALGLLQLAYSEPSEQAVWTICVEAQLIGWMSAYGRIPQFRGKPDLFSDERMLQFVRAIELRRQAEWAAAFALDGYGLLRCAIEEGDQHLRRAQDLLFIDEGSAQDRAKMELELAKKEYDRADRCASAVELVGKVKSELPFLGAWYVRFVAHHSAGEGAQHQNLIAEIADGTSKLEAQLKVDPRPQNNQSADPSALVENLSDQGVGSLYKKLQSAFRANLDSAERTPTWRLIDDVLLVPEIASDHRVKLVEQAERLPLLTSRESTSGGVGASGAPAPAGTAAGPDAQAKADARGELVRTAVYRNWDRQFFDWVGRAFAPGSKATGDDDSEPQEIYSEPIKAEQDKNYARVAGGMKELLAAMEKLDPPTTGQSVPSLAERLPEHMRWMAGRLIEDADASRAKYSLSAARTSRGGLEELERRVRLLEQRDWLHPFRAECPEHLGLDLAPLSIKCQAIDGIPKGSACLLVDVDRTTDGDKVEFYRDKLPIEGGTEAPVKSEGLQTIELAVARGRGDNRNQGPARGQSNGTSVKIEPTVFYRGRTLTGATSDMTVDPMANRFVIWIESDKEAIAADLKRPINDLPADQFTKRAYAVTGFAYPSCSHPILVSILYRDDDMKDKKKVDVDVELRCDEEHQEESWNLTLEPGVPQSFTRRDISFEPTKRRDPKAQPAKEKYLRQRKLVANVWPRGRIGKGNRLAQQVIDLSEVNPEFFNTIDTSLSESVIEQSSGTINVQVSRHADDPVVRPVGIDVRSQEGLHRINRFGSKRGSVRRTALEIDKNERVGLVGGEACTFQFSLPPALPQTRTYHFDVVFAIDYRVHREFTVEGSGKSPAPAAGERGAPPQ